MRLRRRPRADLSAVAPFDRYPARSLRPLIPHTDRLRVTPGTIVVREGRLVRELIVVLEGELTASRDGHGRGRIGPGTLVGAGELVLGGTHPVTLVAGSPLDLLVVHGPAYRWAAQTLPGLADAALAQLGRWQAGRAITRGRRPVSTAPLSTPPADPRAAPARPRAGTGE
jgi:CRP-like cAMP-binding protein